MSKNNILPDGFNSLIELFDYFKTDEDCIKYLAAKRWENGIFCPHCEHENIYQFSDGKRYKCADCRKQFTVKVGTIFEASKISLRKWFAAIFLVISHRKGISSYQLGRDIKVTQKTAWFMLHRIRHVLGIDEELSGTVEADETLIGGDRRNKHAKERALMHTAGHPNWFEEKIIVSGVLQRGGSVIARVMPDAKRNTLERIVTDNVRLFSSVMTDESHAYSQLMEKGYYRYAVNHSANEYVIGEIHTNTIEGFWSCLKRSLYGIYHWVSRKHLQKYLDEACFRYKLRGVKFEGFRVDFTLYHVEGKRLKYKTLINDQSEETAKG